MSSPNPKSAASNTHLDRYTQTLPHRSGPRQTLEPRSNSGRNKTRSSTWPTTTSTNQFYFARSTKEPSPTLSTTTSLGKRSLSPCLSETRTIDSILSTSESKRIRTGSSSCPIGANQNRRVHFFDAPGAVSGQRSFCRNDKVTPHYKHMIRKVDNLGVGGGEGDGHQSDSESDLGTVSSASLESPPPSSPIRWHDNTSDEDGVFRNGREYCEGKGHESQQGSYTDLGSAPDLTFDFDPQPLSPLPDLALVALWSQHVDSQAFHEQTPGYGNCKVENEHHQPYRSSSSFCYEQNTQPVSLTRWQEAQSASGFAVPSAQLFPEGASSDMETIESRLQDSFHGLVS
ncbi:hypothetical protein IAT40_007192 [Kwoniella sp. CBS 6097]